MPWIKAMAIQDLWIGESVAVTVGGRSLLLVNLDGQVHAYEDRCPHQGFPLSRGEREGAVLTCAAHHWQYDLASGRGLNPCSTVLRTFDTEIREGNILVRMDTVSAKHEL